MQRPAVGAALALLLPAPWEHELSADELFEFVTTELGRNGIFDQAETELKRVPQITVFVAHCAPRRAPAPGLRLAAEFLIAFFALNDKPETLLALQSVEPSANGAERWIQGWLERVQREHGARAERFREAFQLYLRSLQQERSYEESPGHPTFEEYVDVERGRYQWVATPPYIELWELALGIELDDLERKRAEPLKQLAVELSYLANDIGSLARDQSSKNYVTLLMQRDQALTTLDSALSATSRVYADKARALVSERLSLPPRSELVRYAECVCDIADGNLRATTLLARSSAEGRYSPLARDCLSKLPLVGSR